jgi:RNA polymerase sigma-70 factor (ECF subfamily)
MIDLQSAHRDWQRIVTGGPNTNAVDSDVSLLALGRSGDSAALERLLARHEAEMLALCRGVLGRAHDAEDAVQESFLRALRGLQRFRGDSSVRTWLYRIAVNVCLEWKRSRGFSHESLGDSMGGHHPSPESEALTRIRLADALTALLPRQRAIILLKELHGFSVTEVADAMGWTATRTQNELYKARKQLMVWRQSEIENEVREGK